MYAAVNGTRLFFDVEGRAFEWEQDTLKAKPVCFVLHGGPGGEHGGFRDYLKPLSSSMQLIFIDQRGCGKSEREDKSTYTLENNIEDLEALRQYLGLNQVVIFGHSYGGMVAQSYALRYPKHIAGLLLIATTPSTIFDDVAKEKIEAIGTEEQKRVAKMLFDSNITNDRDFNAFKLAMEPMYYYSARGKERTEEEIEAYLNQKITFNIDVANEGGKFLYTYDVIAELPSINSPTLVVGGRHDWITPVEASICIAEQIASSELVILEESCHYLFVDEQEKFIEVVASFVERKLMP